jgi:hypothetical protein
MRASRTLTNAVLAASILGGVLTSFGCSTTPDTQAEDNERKVYRTGSNIPVRERGSSGDVRAVDPATIERTAPPPAIRAR